MFPQKAAGARQEKTTSQAFVCNSHCSVRIKQKLRMRGKCLEFNWWKLWNPGERKISETKTKKWGRVLGGSGFYAGGRFQHCLQGTPHEGTGQCQADELQVCGLGSNGTDALCLPSEHHVEMEVS